MILGIDTSAVVCTAALVDRGDVLASFSNGKEKTHSETLLPGVISLLEKTGVKPSGLDAIALSIGPGSFTGLRIGLAAVKGLAVADRIPCAGVSTLQALAYRYLGSREEAILCPVMDARRGEYYNALFSLKEGKIERLTEDRAVTGERLADELRKFSRVIVLGDGAEKFDRQFPGAGMLAPLETRYQSGEAVALLGDEIRQNGECVPCETLSPRYLRLPQAEREWLEKQKKEGIEK